MNTATMNTINDKFLAKGLFAARHNEGLDESQLRRIAPSIFAETAHESRSQKFQVIPTWNAVQALMNEGFVPVAAAQGGTRVAGKADFTKHMIRFRHSTAAMQGNREMLPEIVLRNAADGTSSYRVTAGLFRPICKNGLVSANIVEDFRIGHTGKIVDKVIEGTWSVVGEVHKVVEQADSWQGITLNLAERDVMAEAVHTLRFADASEGTRNAIEPRQLLNAHRAEDANRWDLWHTFNTLQESAIRGGQQGYTIRRPQGGRPVETRVTVRPISSIDGDTALNKALWVLADGMAKIKAGA
jgi:hypothetical protein